MKTRIFILLRVLAFCVLMLNVSEITADVTSEIKTIQQIGHNAENYAAAQKALDSLQSSGPDALLPILYSLGEANPLAANYLRNSFEVIANKTLTEKKSLPLEDLLNFVRRTKNDSKARRLAFEWIRRVSPQEADKLVTNFLNDPSDELRREAVAKILKEIEELAKDDASAEALKRSRYLQALSGASDDDQVRKIVKGLEAFEIKVDLQEHYGFLSDWYLIGPFDNKDEKGFDVAYPPENEIKLDAEYDGQLGNVTWQKYETDDDYGKLNIAEKVGPHKGAVVYAYREFVSKDEQPVEFRLATPNAWKIWLNGELVFEREEYHRGTFFDQYRIPALMKEGRNTLLIKVLQNEQDQSWAQDWQFQFRICQPTGMALRPEKE
ncbi:hypothetical protein [uncultured Rubinisphaera sp.]|mgnify:FL=1|uniref:hypothetical protein n=1 Tax=uncultured Rubinisphaera sp. TaxID=1678686 RepID=UPI0030D977E4